MEHPLTLKRLKELFHYDPNTGIFTRLVAVAKKSYIGEIAGYENSKGYVILRIDYKMYYAHRLAWFYMTGEWPTFQIDHKNEIKNANWFKNLRPASNSENQQNQTKASNNSKSGFLGVFKRGKKWVSVITVNGKRKYLGIFPTTKLASEAYVAAKRELHPFGML